MASRPSPVPARPCRAQLPQPRRPSRRIEPVDRPLARLRRHGRSPGRDTVPAQRSALVATDQYRRLGPSVVRLEIRHRCPRKATTPDRPPAPRACAPALTPIRPPPDRRCRADPAVSINDHREGRRDRAAPQARRGSCRRSAETMATSRCASALSKARLARIGRPSETTAELLAQIARPSAAANACRTRPREAASPASSRSAGRSTLALVRRSPFRPPSRRHGLHQCFSASLSGMLPSAPSVPGNGLASAARSVSRGNEVGHALPRPPTGPCLPFSKRPADEFPGSASRKPPYRPARPRTGPR